MTKPGFSALSAGCFGAFHAKFRLIRALNEAWTAGGETGRLDIWE